MKTVVLKELAILASAILFVSACSSPAPQQSAPPPAVVDQAAPTTAPTTAKPEVSINAVMVALVDHAAHQLWDVEAEGKAPKTDAAWLNVEEHAVQLVAAGPAITVGGNGPTDAVWVKSALWHVYAQGMSDAGVAAMNAAKSKNLMALRTANGQLLDACLACHKEFKPDAPTEGIIHTHAD